MGAPPVVPKMSGYAALTRPTRLGEQMAKGAELDAVIRAKLGGLGYEF